MYIKRSFAAHAAYATFKKGSIGSLCRVWLVMDVLGLRDIPNQEEVPISSMFVDSAIILTH